VAAAVLASVIVGVARTSTILFTGSHQEAPTFWQQYRGHIAIGIVIAAAFYLLGLLTARP